MVADAVTLAATMTNRAAVWNGHDGLERVRCHWETLAPDGRV
jgi:hypothetical protein